MIRVRFLQNVDVDISTIPQGAYGAMGIRHRTSVPRIATSEGGKSGFTMVEQDPQSKHYFRKGRCANLPDEIAQQYIDAGQAERTEQQVLSTDEYARQQQEEIDLIYALHADKITAARLAVKE